MLPDSVPSRPARELGVVRDQSCAAVSGIDGDSVIRRVVEVRLRGRPRLLARVEQNSADSDGDVVVEEEPQGGGVQLAAGWPSRTTAMSAAVSSG